MNPQLPAVVTQLVASAVIDLPDYVVVGDMQNNGDMIGAITQIAHRAFLAGKVEGLQVARAARESGQPVTVLPFAARRGQAS